MVWPDSAKNSRTDPTAWPELRPLGFAARSCDAIIPAVTRPPRSGPSATQQPVVLAAGIAVGLALSASAVATVIELLGDAFDPQQPSYSFRLFANEDERIRRALGDDYSLYSALNEALPERAFLLIQTPPTITELSQAVWLRMLLYPRLVIQADLPSVIATPPQAPSGLPVFALLPDSIAAGALPDEWRLSTALPDFQLLEHQEKTR